MIEKPPKYQEKVEMEATYFDIQIKLQQLRQAPYLPPEGIVMAAGHEFLKTGVPSMLNRFCYLDGTETGSLKPDFFKQKYRQGRFFHNLR
jgi:hypothetical protein